MSFDLPVLPKDWSYAPLDSCSQPNSVTYGVVQPGSALEAGKPLIRVNNFRDTRIDLSDVMYIAPEIEAKYSRTRLKGGEVLLTIVGSVGQVAVVPPRCAGFNVARAVAVIHPLPNIAPEWIALCLRSPLSLHLLGSRANTTVQTTINLKDLRALPIPLPPTAERQTIAKFVGALDDRITLLRETNATLEAIAQALFKSWFVDFDPVRAKMEGRTPEGMDEATAALFPDAFVTSALGDVPAGWQIGSVLDAATLLSGGTPKTDRPDFWGGDILWASAKDVSQASNPVLLDTERTITSLGLNGSSTKIIPAFATVIVARGATTGRMVMFGSDMAMNQTCYALTSRHDAHIALHLMLRREVAALVNAAHGSVFDTITTSTFAQSVCLLPPVHVLQPFEQLARPLYDRIISDVAQAQTLATLRDTLLPRLISGQLRLPEAATIAAEAMA